MKWPIWRHATLAYIRTSSWSSPRSVILLLKTAPCRSYVPITPLRLAYPRILRYRNSPTTLSRQPLSRPFADCCILFSRDLVLSQTDAAWRIEEPRHSALFHFALHCLWQLFHALCQRRLKSAECPSLYPTTPRLSVSWLRSEATFLMFKGTVRLPQRLCMRRILRPTSSTLRR